MPSLPPLLLLAFSQKRNKIREAAYHISQGAAKPTFEECIKLGIPERTVRRWVAHGVVHASNTSIHLASDHDSAVAITETATSI